MGMPSQIRMLVEARLQMSPTKAASASFSTAPQLPSMWSCSPFLHNVLRNLLKAEKASYTFLYWKVYTTFTCFNVTGTAKRRGNDLRSHATGTAFLVIPHRRKCFWIQSCLCKTRGQGSVILCPLVNSYFSHMQRKILRFKPKGFVTLNPLFHCTHFHHAWGDLCFQEPLKVYLELGTQAKSCTSESRGALTLFAGHRVVSLIWERDSDLQNKTTTTC